MKKILSLLASVIGLSGAAFAQSTTPINPCNGVQQFYIDRNFHTVPYVVARPNNGITTVVFDPTTSQTDINNAFANFLKNAGGNPLGGVPTYVISANAVNTSFNEQVTRVTVPFSVNSSTSGTTLTTIPFNVGTILETNGHYKFVAKLYVNLGSGGSKIDVGGTCNTSNFVAQYYAIGGTTNVYGGQLLSFLSGPAGASNSTATEITIEGELDVTNGGTFVIQFAQNGANATNSTVLAGSTFTVTQIP